MKYLFLLTIILVLSCGYSLHQVHLSDADLATSMGKIKKIESEGKQFVFFGFAFDNNYVDKAYRELLDQCPDGEIIGITTRYSTSLGFLSWNNKLYVQGFCKPE